MDDVEAREHDGGGGGSSSSSSSGGGVDAAVSRALFNGVRYGMKSQVLSILGQTPALVHAVDAQGYSLVHWAAKKGDVDVLQALSDAGAVLNQPTASDTRMQPIHWAASEGRISSIHFLLGKRHQDINAQDANGCTPVVIASQHNQLNCVVYLVKNGADMSLKDNNQDTALHWAAYKGYVEMVGLLTSFLPHEIDSDDVFGQTPLHLSALRGNTAVVEHLVMHCGADCTKKDRNGLTPLELTVKKKQLKTEWALRKLTFKGSLAVALSLGMKRLRDPTILMFMVFGSDDWEMHVWAWRIVFVSNLLGSLTTFFVFAMSEAMGNLSTLHLVNTMAQLLWWVSFTLCLQRAPTFVRETTTMGSGDRATGTGIDSNTGSDVTKVDASARNLRAYAVVLDAIGRCVSERDANAYPSLCHTCKVVRPLRSKHCKMLRRCVRRFDHFCPFVGNTLGQDNYKWFIALIYSHLVAGTLWLVTATYYTRRVKVSWTFTVFMAYSALWMIPIFTLVNYHTWLLSKNLTTNEHLNAAKYAYMRDEYDDYSNPFDTGSVWTNAWDGLFPPSTPFFSRDEVLRAASSPPTGAAAASMKGTLTTTSSSGSNGGGCGGGGSSNSNRGGGGGEEASGMAETDGLLRDSKV